MHDKLPLLVLENESAIIILDNFEGLKTNWVYYFLKRRNIVHYFDSFGNMRPLIEL